MGRYDYLIESYYRGIIIGYGNIIVGVVRIYYKSSIQ